MAQYKVIQDIEAEDKLVGPFSLRQFIYLAIVLILGYLAYQTAKVNFFVALPFLPPILFFGALAAPFGGVQSTEVWLLAKIRFVLKPRKRIWNQDGQKELVKITVPKKEEKQLTDNLSKNEVKSRLSALASTLDSRGWAVKYAAGPASAVYGDNDDQRLLGEDAFAPPEPIIADNTVDVMDDKTSAAAQQFESMLQQSNQTHRQQLMENVKHPTAPKKGDQAAQDYWFMSSQPGNPKGQNQPTYQAKTVMPGSDDYAVKADDKGVVEQEFLDKVHQNKKNAVPTTKRMKTLHPLSEQTANQPTQPAPQPDTAKTVKPDILRLAGNDDLNVSTLAREANRSKEEPDDGEVVISLH